MSLLNQQMTSQVLLSFLMKLRLILSDNLRIMRIWEKWEFDNNKFNQNITNIHLDDMFTNGPREMKECNKSLRGVILQNIIAILVRSALVDNKEKERLEMHYGFKQEDITKEIERIFTNENKQSYDQSKSTEW